MSYPAWEKIYQVYRELPDPEMEVALAYYHHNKRANFDNVAMAAAIEFAKYHAAPARATDAGAEEYNEIMALQETVGEG